MGREKGMENTLQFVKENRNQQKIFPFGLIVGMIAGSNTNAPFSG
jgi:hypothetical protein